jgi:predicted nucleic acid-binding protein
MDLVLDANIIISATIRRGFTLRLLSDPRLSLQIPEFCFDECFANIAEISIKSGLVESEIIEIIERIGNRAHLVTWAQLEPFAPEAKILSPDKDDWVYFAAALSQGIPIWSNDRKLKEQNQVIILTTEEVARRLRII